MWCPLPQAFDDPEVMAAVAEVAENPAACVARCVLKGEQCRRPDMLHNCRLPQIRQARARAPRARFLCCNERSGRQPAGARRSECAICNSCAIICTAAAAGAAAA